MEEGIAAVGAAHSDSFEGICFAEGTRLAREAFPSESCKGTAASGRIPSPVTDIAKALPGATSLMPPRYGSPSPWH